MIQLQEIENKITKSKLPQNYKERIVAMLPKLGESVSIFVYSEAQKMGFEYIGDVLFSILKMILSVQDELRQNNEIQAVNILKTAVQNPVWENGQYILPWALDIEQLIQKNKISPSEELKQALLDFELDVFESLPVENVQDILTNYTVNILKRKIDLLVFLKKYIYFKHWENDAKIVRPLVDALFSNQEILADGKNIFGEKSGNGTLQNIFNDFLITFASSDVHKVSFNISKYIISKKIVENLSKENREVLLKVLEIYAWFLMPTVKRAEIGLEEMDGNYVTEGEYDNFDTEADANDFTNTQQFTLPQEIAESQDDQQPVVKLPPVVPVPKNAPFVKPMGDVETGIRKQEFGIRNAADKDGAGIKLPPALPPVSEIMKQQLADPAPQRTSVVNGYRPQPTKSIHDILQERDSGDGVGLRTGNGNAPAQAGKNQFSIADKNQSSLSTASAVQKPVKLDAIKQAEIDRKLQELESKLNKIDHN